jgi:hypothetical protein
MECEFCKKTFLSKNVLCHHQKTAKYCLELQGTTITNFECNYCKKYLASNERLVTHLNICKSKNIIEISEKEKQHENKLKEKDVLHTKELKDKDNYYEILLREKNEYISKLEAKLEKMEAKLDAKLEKLESTVTTIALESKTVSTKASQAITTTNNTTLNTNITVNNVLNLSEEHVKKVLSERLNYNVVYAGQAGLATFVVDNMLKDATGKLIYRCVDASRQMFEFIDENGETVRDMKAEKLTQSLLKGDVIKLGLEAAAVGWNTENEKLNTERVGVFGPKVNEYADLNRNNTVFRSKVSSLTT